jgi:hypothetical protein
MKPPILKVAFALAATRKEFSRNIKKPAEQQETFVFYWRSFYGGRPLQFGGGLHLEFLSGILSVKQ